MAPKDLSPAAVTPLPPPVQKAQQHTGQEQHPGFGKLTTETRDVIDTQQNLQVGRLTVQNFLSLQYPSCHVLAREGRFLMILMTAG